MRHTTYLNTILTVNALLLGGLLWTHVADRPLLGESAAAAAPEQADSPGQVPVPDSFTSNSGMRQQQILEATNQLRQGTIEAMHRIESKLEATNRLLQNGPLKVQVTNLGDIQAAESR